MTAFPDVRQLVGNQRSHEVIGHLGGLIGIDLHTAPAVMKGAKNVLPAGVVQVREEHAGKSLAPDLVHVP